MNILLYIIFLIPIIGKSQNAISYFEQISIAEDYFIKGEIDSSLNCYNVAFEKFNYPFIREIFQATVVASYSTDKSDFYKLLKKCIVRGLDTLELELFEKRYKNDSLYRNIKNEYRFLRNKYLESIDTNIYKLFKGIDINDQIATQRSQRNNYDLSYRNFEDNKKKYTAYIDKYGWPTENKVGIGNHVLLAYFNSEKEVDNYKYKEFFYEKLNDSILTKNNKYIVIVFSCISRATSVTYQNTRCGNGFLWHYTCMNDTLFNNFLFIEGVLNLKIHPLFLAQGIERAGIEDYLLGVGSNYYEKRLKYKLEKKYHISNEDKNIFDNERAKYFIRPLEKEEQIIKQLIFLESKKDLKKIKRIHTRKFNDLIYSFVNKNVA